MALVHKNVHWLDGQKETALHKLTKSYFNQKIKRQLYRLPQEIEPECER